MALLEEGYNHRIYKNIGLPTKYFLDAIASLHLIMSVTQSVSHSLTITLSKYNKKDLYNLHGQLLISLLTLAVHWPNDLSFSLA